MRTLTPSNALNSLNRQSFLNMNSLCLSIAIFVKSCYSNQSRLFVVRLTGIASKEGTNQGDPVSMEIYDIRVTHLINMLIEILSELVESLSFGTKIKITVAGDRYFGGSVGTKKFKVLYVTKVNE